MSYRVIDVADYIISRAYQCEKPISNLKLQKMLYYAWVDFYKKTSQHLFYESICAWPLGPVVPEVYNEYCSYGGRPIRLILENTDIKGSDSYILNQIIDKYIDIPASVLVNQTHTPGGAWDTIYKNGSGNREAIPFSLINECEARRKQCFPQNA